MTYSKLQDALEGIAGNGTDSDRRSGIADLQDSLRSMYQQRRIPIEGRQGYTDLAIPGRNFLAENVRICGRSPAIRFQIR